ncbi:hypothetical protein MC885_015569, partial [Smutsia gigantea]
VGGTAGVTQRRRGLRSAGAATVRPPVGVTDVGVTNLWAGVADVGGPSPTVSDPRQPRFLVSPQRAPAAEPPTESRGRKERGSAPLAPAAAMKAVVQRVTRASVTVAGEQISAIERGICVLLGVSLEDTQKEVEHMVRKILNLRVFEDDTGKHWSKSVMDKQYEVLCVSQFTLQCVLKGNKPDFHLAMPTEQAESFYNSFLEQLRKTYRPELVKVRKN